MVRRIFSSYLDSMGVIAIAKMLNSLGVPSGFGNPWASSVSRVLRNAYTGNLLLKRPPGKHLTKCRRQNNGEFPQYHITDAHEEIIPLEQFNAVQEEIKRRAEKHSRPGVTPNSYPFSGKLVCAGCGKHYRRKITKTGPVWICGTFNTWGKAACASKQIPASTLVSVVEELLGSMDAFPGEITGVRVENGNQLVFFMPTARMR